ncbi:DUF202 domain-containing protein [Micromonospora sp. NPDC050187]|uniref:DUF202 domain-containing protein n=1 Tax=Micromonospora sp. NPDC050187 TaxID=3364277 RepID=UPI003796C408
MTGRDHGLQRERTALAWRRTCAVALVDAVLLGRLAPNLPLPQIVVGSGSMLALAVTAAWWYRRRAHRSPDMPPPALMGLVAILVTVAALTVVVGLAPVGS